MQQCSGCRRKQRLPRARPLSSGGWVLVGSAASHSGCLLLSCWRGSGACLLELHAKVIGHPGIAAFDMKVVFDMPCTDPVPRSSRAPSTAEPGASEWLVASAPALVRCCLQAYHELREELEQARHARAQSEAQLAAAQAQLRRLEVGAGCPAGRQASSLLVTHGGRAPGGCTSQWGGATQSCTAEPYRTAFPTAPAILTVAGGGAPVSGWVLWAGGQAGWHRQPQGRTAVIPARTARWQAVNTGLAGAAVHWQALHPLQPAPPS